MSKDELRPGWVWCPRCQMMTPQFIFDEFCVPHLEAAAALE
jgi:hypothetical protein